MSAPDSILGLVNQFNIQIASPYTQIDALVSELHGLTEEEIRLVKGV